MARRAVFIDRDGVIVEARIINGVARGPLRREELKFLPRADEALKLLKDLGFLRILVTNQPDVAYGSMTEEEWRWIQDRVEDLDFDDVFICRHRRDEGCKCRKPNPGMIFAAAKKWDIDLSLSYMVGDTANDIGAACAAGITGILVATPYNADVCDFDYAVDGLWSAAILIRFLSSLEKEV